MGQGFLAFPAWMNSDEMMLIGRKKHRIYLEQDVGNKVINLTDEFEHLVIRQVFEGEFTLSSIAGVCLP